jgi:hypothetical protein
MHKSYSSTCIDLRIGATIVRPTQNVPLIKGIELAQNFVSEHGANKVGNGPRRG